MTLRESVRELRERPNRGETRVVARERTGPGGVFLTYHISPISTFIHTYTYAHTVCRESRERREEELRGSPGGEELSKRHT